MRKIYILLIIVVILPLFTVISSAEGEVDKYIDDFESVVPDGLSWVNDSDGLLDFFGFKRLLSQIVEIARGNLGEVGDFMLLLLGSVIILSLCDSIGGSVGEDACCAVGVICSVLIFRSMWGIFEDVTATLSDLSGFFTSLIPITAGLTALGGGSLSAATQTTAMYTTVGILGDSAVGIFGSIISLGFAMSLLSSFGSEEISAVCRGIRSVFFWLLGIFTTIITGGLSLQSILSCATDSAGIRAAKYMASGLIPVVGSTVSASLSTLGAGVSYAKGVVGVGAVAVIISLLLSPLVLLLMYRLSLSVALIISDFTGRLSSRILSAYRFGLDLLIALYTLSGVIYIFEIILFIKIGVALL